MNDNVVCSDCEMFLFIFILILTSLCAILIFGIACKYFFVDENKDKDYYEGYIDGLWQKEINQKEIKNIGQEKSRNYLKGFSEGYIKNREKK